MQVQDSKVCNECGQSKATSEYYGREGKCKTCRLALNKRWREANAAQFKEITRRWRSENEGHIYGNPGEYQNYIGYKHPIAAPGGITRYHRIVLWDKLQGKDAHCYWCFTPVFWGKSHNDSPDALVVDHLNSVKDDNRPENLVPACQRCNAARGTRKNPEKCTFFGCARKAYAKALCQGHYQQQLSGRELTPLRQYKRAAA